MSSWSLEICVSDAHLIETLTHSLAVLVCDILLASHGDEEFAELLVVIVRTLLQLSIILLS